MSDEQMKNAVQRLKALRQKLNIKALLNLYPSCKQLTAGDTKQERCGGPFDSQLEPLYA